MQVGHESYVQKCTSSIDLGGSLDHLQIVFRSALTCCVQKWSKIRPISANAQLAWGFTNVQCSLCCLLKLELFYALTVMFLYMLCWGLFSNCGGTSVAYPSVKGHAWFVEYKDFEEKEPSLLTLISQRRTVPEHTSTCNFCNVFNTQASLVILVGIAC
jgi:hypothetical protein